MSVLKPHWPTLIGQRPTVLNLEGVTELLKRLGNPHHKMPPALHIAGTNGKGSVVSFLRYMLVAAGYKVHVYTSPHLVYFNERIVIDNSIIDDRFLYDVLEECRIACGGLPITLFEATTAAAFLAFSRIKADFVIIETGMGGRLDATNVLENTLISIITSISFDHIEHLGRTLEKIAYEKAGIIKNNSVCVISRQLETARLTIEKVAVERHTSVYRQNFEWYCTPDKKGMVFETGGEKVMFPFPALVGKHQIENAGCAIAALTLLHNKYNFTQVTHESISKGLKSTYWPARLEFIKKGYFYNLLSKGWELILDGAHNEAGAQTIANWLEQEKAHFIVGITRKKGVIPFLTAIQKNIASLHGICVQSEFNSHTAQEICEFANSMGIPARPAESLKEAIIDIISINPQPSKIIICGSLFLAKDLILEI